MHVYFGHLSRQERIGLISMYDRQREMSVLLKKKNVQVLNRISFDEKY